MYEIKEQNFIRNNKDIKFDFFGVLVDPIEEVPFFKKKDGGYVRGVIIPFTPKMLEFCVKHLTVKERKLHKTHERFSFFS